MMIQTWGEVSIALGIDNYQLHPLGLPRFVG